MINEKPARYITCRLAHWTALHGSPEALHRWGLVRALPYHCETMDEWGSMNMDGQQNQNRNKTKAAKTQTHTTEQNQTKTPPGDRHPSTHSEAQAWWRGQHWRTPTRMLVWWHGGSSHQRQMCCKGHRRGPRGPFSSEQYDFMITQHPNVLLEKSKVS